MSPNNDSCIFFYLRRRQKESQVDSSGNGGRLGTRTPDPFGVNEVL
jgi:hypothetical protein